MKTIKILTLILLLLACNNSPKTDTKVAIILDVSDTMELAIKSSNIKNLLPTDVYTGATIVVAPATDLRYNKVRKFSIRSAHELTGNLLERQKEYKKLTQNINNSISEIKHGKIGTDGSYIISSINNAITELGHGAVIYVCSDFMEHTPLFSLYDKNHVAYLNKNQNALFKTFDKTYPIHNTENVRIVVLYTPKNKQADSDFSKSLQLFERYYQTHGITVQHLSNFENE